MLNFNSNIKINLKSYSDFTLQKKYKIPFGVNSSPYVKSEAQKGKLYRVTIKKVNLVKQVNTYQGVSNIFNYIDTFNEMWFENELCWKDEALELAKNYYQKILEAS